MKKLLLTLTFVLATVFALALSANANTDIYERFKGSVGETQMKYATPVIDGNITANDGWGKGVNVGESNLVPVFDRIQRDNETYTSGSIRYAYDENNLYFAADIVDSDFSYCKEYIKDNLIAHNFIREMPKNDDGSFKLSNGYLLLIRDDVSFFGYDGDVVALAFNWNDRLITECGMLTEFPTFINFGLFEDGHVGVYQTVYGEKDLTSTVTAKGVRTEQGWRFEAAIPWSVIEENFELTSIGDADFNYKEATTVGSYSKACVYFVDRFYDLEMDELSTENLYATYNKFNSRGALSFYSGKVEIGLFGIDLVPTKTGSDYTSKVKKTSLEWENTFSDVNENAWYYKAVAKVCNDGWFSGTSLTAFSPSSKLTRAMFVTVLSKMARCDDLESTGTMFTDVPKGKWYSGPIEWAAECGFASGTGNGCFSPNATLTREQCALFLYKFAEYKRYRVDDADSTAVNKFADKDTISAWALNAMNWAVTKGLISGIAEGKTVKLAPKGTATRAQCAQIVRAFDTASFTHLAKSDEYADMTICGNDISDYVIIYAGGQYDQKAASELREYIEKVTNVKLDIYRDTAQPAQEKEILVGKTNREGLGLVIDYSDVTVEGYTIVTKNNKLIISGGEKKGTLYGVYGFVEKYMGWIFASSHKAKSFETGYQLDENVEIEGRYAISDINLADGICDVENSLIDAMAWCDFGMTEDWNTKMRIAGNRVTLDDGVQTGLPLAIAGNDFDEWWMARMGPNPCYSNPDVLERAATMTIERIKANYPEMKSYSFAPYDNYQNCTCERCTEINRREGTRGGTYFCLVKYVADAVAKEYPDVIIYPSAYGSLQGAPEYTKMPYNVAIRYVQLSTCYHHELDDENCDINKWAYAELLKWGDACEILWIGDHGVTFDYNMVPCMNFDFLYSAHKIYSSLGYTGYIYWPDMGNREFNTTRDYLINHMLWAPETSRDEYWIWVESVFEARFGSAWKDVLDYYDTMVEIQKDCHFTTVANIESSYSKALLHSEVDRLDALWAKMLNNAKDDTQSYTELYALYAYYLIVRNDCQWEYEYKNGTEAQKEKYIALNKELADIISKYEIDWSENKNEHPSVNYATPPSRW